jgi:hypothetical protein
MATLDNDDEYKGTDRRKNRESSMQDIRENISEIRTDIALLINKVDANHASLRASTDSIQQLVYKHEKTIYGNGQQGLTTKIEEIKTVKEDLKNHSFYDRLMFGGMFTLLITIVGFLIAK